MLAWIKARWNALRERVRRLINPNIDGGPPPKK
jgi:hypothetical protein